MKLSVVINLDTRNYNDVADTMFNGCVNTDFLVDGVINKIKLFDGFDAEFICYVDEHNPIPDDILKQLLSLVDTIVVRKHTGENGFNDRNYIRALSLASGDVIIHFDQDTAAFASSKQSVENFLKLLDNHEFVSYPSYWSPLPCHDDTFDHVWCSTRFFMCKRENLDLPEITKCANDYDYWCEKYPVARRCPWLEHWVGSIAKYRNQSVYYPPLDFSNIIIFSWGSYKTGTLKLLNGYSFEEVYQWLGRNPMQYPNDVML